MWKGVAQTIQGQNIICKLRTIFTFYSSIEVPLLKDLILITLPICVNMRKINWLLQHITMQHG